MTVPHSGSIQGLAPLARHTRGIVTHSGSKLAPGTHVAKGLALNAIVTFQRGLVHLSLAKRAKAYVNC